MADLPKYEGVPIYMGGKEYVVPPLSIKYIRNNRDKLKEMRTLAVNLDVLTPEGDAFFSASLELIHAAIVRNYPEVTRDELEEMIDLGTMPQITLAIMHASGFTFQKGPASGEAVAAG
jgi:hypothetical protein